MPGVDSYRVHLLTCDSQRTDSELCIYQSVSGKGVNAQTSVAGPRASTLPQSHVPHPRGTHLLPP